MADVPSITLDPYLAGVQAVLFALQEAGLIPDLNPLDYIISAFDGRPKLEDTELAALRLLASPWWPLKALGSNLQIWVRNGVPLSTGIAAYRAQLSEWIRGTIDSLEPIVYGRLDPYTLDHAIWLSMTSQDGDHAIVELNNTIAQQHALGPLPALPNQPPTGGPGGVPGTGPNTIQDTVDGDELNDIGQTIIFQLSQLYALLTQVGSQQPPSGADDCCLKVVQSIAAVTGQLTVIAEALLSGNQPIDFSPITGELAALVDAVKAYPPAAAACCAALGGKLDSIANAIANLALGSGLDVSGIVDQLKNANALELLPVEFVDAMVAAKTIPPELAQLFSARPWHWSITAVLSGVAHFLFGGINPDLGTEVAANIKAVNSGGAAPYQPIHSLSDVLIYILSIVGNYGALLAVELAGALLPTAQLVVKQIGAAIAGADPSFVVDEARGVGAPAVAAIKYVQGAPSVGEVVTVDNYQTIAQDAFGRAGTVGMVAYAAAMVGGFIMGPWEKYWGEVAALLSTAAGFEEISERLLGPFFDAVIAHRARQDANSKWPTLVPPGPQSLTMWARRKLGDADRDTLLGYAGIDPTFRPPMIAAAYRPISPRALATAIVDTPFPKDEMQAILEDNAFTPEHVAFMLQVLEYNSTKNLRSSYINEAVAAYKAGVMPDAELDDILTSVGWSDQAKQFVRSRALLQRRVTLAAEAEKNIVPEVAAGLIAPTIGLQQLEAAGIEPWYAELQITLAETKAALHAAKLAEAEAEREARQAQRNLTRAAVAEYQRGVIDSAGLTAALAAIGLTPSLIASTVAVQDATRAGRMRYLYGQLLSPSDAKLLTEKIAAIGQQTKDQLISLDQAFQQLTALKVDAADAQALVARWAATLKKSPGSSVLVQP